jgi:hypothetical protein
MIIHQLCVKKKFDKLRINLEKGNTSNEKSFNENLVDQSKKKKVNCFYCKKP